MKKKSENVKNAFSLSKNSTKNKNKNLLIIDDLVTTGATIKSAAKVLYRLNPKSITAVTACRSA